MHNKVVVGLLPVVLGRKLLGTVQFKGVVNFTACRKQGLFLQGNVRELPEVCGCKLLLGRSRGMIYFEWPGLVSPSREHDKAYYIIKYYIIKGQRFAKSNV